MPELPEVQTIVNDLQILVGDTVSGFWTDFKRAIKSKDFNKELVGQKIVKIERVGKNIVFKLGSRNFLLLHLKMTGKLILGHQSSVISHQKRKHLHHIFFLKKNGVLEFHDIRKFATLEIINNEKFSGIMKTKGIDPFSTYFIEEKLSDLIAKRKNKNIKAFLMDQTAISGIGNIYASEIPFEAKLNPHKKVASLTKKEISILYKAIIKILTKAIELRGTSFSDYRDAAGKKGAFQNFLKVYKKAGKNCPRCGTIIEKSVVEQRSTFHCPICQR